MKNNITKKILITISLIVLLLFWQAIPVIILALLKINFNNMPKIMKVLISFASDLLLLILLLFIYRKTIKKDLHNYFNKNIKEHLLLSFKTWLMGFGIMIVSNIIITLLTNGQLSQNEESVRELIDMYPFYMLFQLMIYAPITEEIIFRKSIKDIFHNKVLYIIVSGLIFGGLHVITSLENPLGFLYLIPYCSLGCIFAYLYQKTDNIFSTITAHSFHNTLALLIYLRGIRWKKYYQSS